MYAENVVPMKAVKVVQVTWELWNPYFKLVKQPTSEGHLILWLCSQIIGIPSSLVNPVSQLIDMFMD